MRDRSVTTQQRILALAVGCLGLASPMSAGGLDPQPLGEEFCVLEESTLPSEGRHFLAGLPNSGGLWVMAYGKLTSDNRLASFFDSDGLPVGPEIILDEPFVGSQAKTSDVVSDEGSDRWLAVWHGSGSPGNDSSLTSVKARLFDIAGLPLGDSFQVNTTVQGVQNAAKAAFLSGGGFVVVFADRPVTPSVFRVRARVYDSTGTPLGDDILITKGPSEGSFPEVVPTPTGGFIVAYRARGSGTGDPLGIGVSEHLANGTLADSSVIPIAGLDGTNVLTAETDTEGNLRLAVAEFVPPDDLIIRVFLIERPLGLAFRETQVAPGGGFHGSPDLVPTPDGGVGLVWLNVPSGTSGEGANSVLRFSAENEPVSAIVDLNGENPEWGAGTSDATMLDDGRVIAVWGNEASNPQCLRLARFFRIPELVFADGFESGDTSTWSVTVNPP